MRLHSLVIAFSRNGLVLASLVAFVGTVVQAIRGGSIQTVQGIVSGGAGSGHIAPTATSRLTRGSDETELLLSIQLLTSCWRRLESGQVSRWASLGHSGQSVLKISHRLCHVADGQRPASEFGAKTHSDATVHRVAGLGESVGCTHAWRASCP